VAIDDGERNLRAIGCGGVEPLAAIKVGRSRRGRVAVCEECVGRCEIVVEDRARVMKDS